MSRNYGTMEPQTPLDTTTDTSTDTSNDEGWDPTYKLTEMFRDLEDVIQGQPVSQHALMDIRRRIEAIRLHIHNRYWCTRCTRGGFTSECSTNHCDNQNE